MPDLHRMVETFLQHALQTLPMPAPLREAMNYSLLAGGKRLRPVLCLMCADMCAAQTGMDEENRQLLLEHLLPFAAGLEMIHTYSLIHDDLPAMDDDDLRRGRPSCHKAFDEATAILAGDALNTDAFAFMSRVGFGPNALSAERVLKAMLEVATAAGSAGMVGGQVLDMGFAGQELPSGPEARLALTEPLRNMQALKTGALFRASCLAGGILGGASECQCTALRAYSLHFGVAFQIVDDILDVTQDTVTLGKPAGSDEAQGKITWPALFGLEHSRNVAGEAIKSALHALDGFTHASELRDLTSKMLLRIN